MNRRLKMTAFLGAGLIRLLGTTLRVRVIDEQYLEEAQRISPAVVFAVWHGRMLVLSYSHRAKKIHVLASEHKDGELMGQTIRFLGFGHIRGSSTRGGVPAIRRLVGKLREGFDVGITVDGPKGPRHVVKSGLLEIAKLSGCAIIPLTVASKRCWTASSWDAFQIPKPFTRAWLRYGKPLAVTPNASPEELEEKRLELERILQTITKECDETAAR